MVIRLEYCHRRRACGLEVEGGSIRVYRSDMVDPLVQKDHETITVPVLVQC